MSRFKHFVVIYNPKSTGDSEGIAKKFAEEVKGLLPKAKIEVIATEYAGHAEELAYDYARKIKGVFIISVSGDGGYNEVINGAAKAADKGDSQPMCAVLPGGNANDHHKSVYSRPLIEAIKEESIHDLDLLALYHDGTVRYAHSYIGLGLTPLVAVELNKHKLSALKEAWLAVKAFWAMRPFAINLEGRTVKFDSLVFANIDRMAKHLTLAKKSSPRDGKFEVIKWQHTSKRLLIKQLIKSVLGKELTPDRRSEVVFETVKSIPIQLDGEVAKLKARTEVKVTCHSGKLCTVR